MKDETIKAMRSALIDADHLAECSERLLVALNKRFGAEQRLAAEVEGHRIKEATEELERAQETVSEFWRGVRSAIYEYRKRSERAREAMGSNGELTGCADSKSVM